MGAREWALIIFTILGQMSVGAFVVLGFVHFFAMRKAGAEEADRLSDRALLAIGPVLILGMFASLFHLGNPLNAYKAIANIETSWLSREILFGVIFAVLGAVFAIMQWRKIGNFGLRNVIAWVTAVVGLMFVYSMSQVYRLPTQPSWDALATPITFFITTFLLGALAIGAAFVANIAYIKRKDDVDLQVQMELLRGSLRWIALVSILLLGVELIVSPLYIANLATGGETALASVQLMIGMGWVLALRLVLLFIGAGVFGVFLYQSTVSTDKMNVIAAFAYSAFVLVLVSEVMGRFLFYATHVRVGI
ncbi:MAG: DmsC/YnfH family molybdoenzyme membrane anchor subunit [Chloroflexota bacterium]